MTTDTDNLIKTFAETNFNRSKKVKSMVYITVLVVIICSSFIFWATYRVNASFLQMQKLSNEKQALQKAIDSSRQQIQTLQYTIKESKSFLPYLHPFDISTIKRASHDGNEAYISILFNALEFQTREVQFKLGGKSPETGFDSPSMMAYILVQLNLMPNNVTLTSASIKDHTLPVNNNELQKGDLIFYEGGYVMLYTTLDGQGACIGMTPIGIVSLDKNFAPVTDIRRPQYY